MHRENVVHYEISGMRTNGFVFWFQKRKKTFHPVTKHKQLHDYPNGQPRFLRLWSPNGSIDEIWFEINTRRSPSSPETMSQLRVPFARSTGRCDAGGPGVHTALCPAT